MYTFHHLFMTINRQLDKSSTLALLAIRLILAYGFLMAAQNHWSNIEGTILFFSNIGIPFATFNAYLVSLTEFLGAGLLTVGLLTRYISIPLIITMLVAIITVHWNNGYEAFKNIPENSFLFNGDTLLGTTSGVEIFNDGVKLGAVEVYATGGMEIPITYIAMLLVLVAYGSGKISIERFISAKD